MLPENDLLQLVNPSETHEGNFTPRPVISMQFVTFWR